MGWLELLDRAQGMLQPGIDSVTGPIGDHLEARSALYQQDTAEREARDQAYRQAQMQAFLDMLDMIREKGVFGLRPDAQAPLPAPAGMIPGVSGALWAPRPRWDATTRPIIGGVRD